MTTLTIAQRHKDALEGLDFDAPDWTIAPLIDTSTSGHHARGQYVEEFWLPVLGPTCTTMLRHFAGELRDAGGTYDVPVELLPRLFGLGNGNGRHSLFGRSIARLVSFEMAEIGEPTTLLVRTVAPWLSAGQVARLHPTLRGRHDHWLAASCA
jgi:hypothetical protein